MGKTTATLLVLGLAWIGYVAWPLYDLYVLVQAFEARDVETLKTHVYFDSVRRSLADQIVAAYQILGSIGQLTARQIGLGVDYYDPIDNYDNVRNKWFGTDVNTVD